jgi:hypothetical protein
VSKTPVARIIKIFIHNQCNSFQPAKTIRQAWAYSHKQRIQLEALYSPDQLLLESLDLFLFDL